LLYNDQAESMVLAAILRNPDDYFAINDVGLVAEDFLGPENRRVARAVLEVVDEKKRPDLPFVLESLRLAGNDGSDEYVANLTGVPCSVEQAHDYVRTVKGLAVARGVTRAGAKFIEIGRERRSDFESAIAECENVWKTVTNNLPHMDDSPLAADILRRIAAEGPESSIPLMFAPTLNYITGGLQTKNLWVIGGFSSTGKSAVGCNMVLDVLKTRGKRVVIISTEMSQKQYMIRLLSILSGVPQLDIKNGVIKGLENQQALAEATRFLEKSNLEIYDTVNKWASIKSKLRQINDRKGLDVVVLDYIQNIRVNGDVYGDARDVAVESLALAKELDTAVIAFSQVSNAMANQDIQEKGQGEYYSFKGAGDIRDSSDVSIMLRRDRKAQSPILKFDIAKNRHGALVRFDTHIDLPTGKIEEREWETAEEVGR
jgi:replicative DNA helicase